MRLFVFLIIFAIALFGGVSFSLAQSDLDLGFGDINAVEGSSSGSGPVAESKPKSKILNPWVPADPVSVPEVKPEPEKSTINDGNIAAVDAFDGLSSDTVSGSENQPTSVDWGKTDTWSTPDGSTVPERYPPQGDPDPTSLTSNPVFVDLGPLPKAPKPFDPNSPDVISLIDQWLASKGLDPWGRERGPGIDLSMSPDAGGLLRGAWLWSNLASSGLHDFVKQNLPKETPEAKTVAPHSPDLGSYTSESR